MKDLELFETSESCRVGNEDSVFAKFSAICDDNGEFSIHCYGKGGKEGLMKFLNGITNEIANQGKVVIGKNQFESAYGISLTDEQYANLCTHNLCMATAERRYPVFHIVGVLKTMGLI